MAGSRPLVSILFALSAFLIILAVSADDSAILTPIATAPVGDYEGADAPAGFDDSTGIDGAVEGPDASAGLLGSPMPGSTEPEGDASKPSGASSINKAVVVVAAAGAFVGYLAF